MAFDVLKHKLIYFINKVKSAKSKSGYFAELLHETLSELNLNSVDLTRLLVTRSEVFMLIKNSFSFLSLII